MKKTTALTLPQAPPPRRAAETLGRPLFAAALIAAGYFAPRILGGSQTAYNTLVVIAIYAVMSYGVDVILSYLGEVSLGHTIFWASGAYAAGMLSTRVSANGWVTLAAAVGISIVLAAGLGVLTLRTREFVFSLVTYAAAVVALNVAHNWAFLGGSDGVVGIPPLQLPLPGLHLSAGSNAELWPYAYAMLVLVVFFIHRFRRSKLGAAALMVHMNPGLASTLGVDTGRIRLLVFVLSAPITAMAGWMYAYQRAYVGPDLFESFFLLIMLTAVVITGRRILVGPLIGTAIIIAQQNLASVGGDGDKLVLGLVLAVVLIAWPKGLVGVWQAIRSRTA